MAKDSDKETNFESVFALYHNTKAASKDLEIETLSDAKDRLARNLSKDPKNDDVISYPKIRWPG